MEAKVGVDGSYEKVMYCTTCHEELSREKIVIPALKEPDTEEPGTETPEPDTEKPVHKHSYVLKKTTEATCMKEGEKIYSCACGEECDHVQLVQNSIETGENQCTKDGKIVERSL